MRFRLGVLFVIVSAAALPLNGCGRSVTPADQGKQAGAKSLVQRAMADERNLDRTQQTTPETAGTAPGK